MSEEKRSNQRTIDGNACGIDALKLGEGLAAVFRGYSLIFEALADQAGILGGMQPSAQPAATVPGAKPAQVTEEKQKEMPTAKSSVKAAEPKAVNPVTQPETVDNADETSDPSTPSITKAEFLSEVQGMVRKSAAMQKQVKQLMDAYGIKSLSSTPPEQYEAFLKDARDLSRKS